MRRRIVKDAAVRREELLELALRLFSEKGYDDTAVQDITDAAGVAKGTFYHYFPTKERLLDELAASITDRIVGESAPAVERLSDDPVAALRLLIDTVVPWRLTDARDPGRAWLHVLYAERNLALRDRLMSSFHERLRPHFSRVIAAGAASGVFRIDEPEPTSDVVLAMWHGMSDHLAELLLVAAGDPTGVDTVLTHLRVMEVAIERVLGMAPGSLALHDYEALAVELPGMAGGAGTREGMGR